MAFSLAGRAYVTTTTEGTGDYSFGTAIGSTFQLPTASPQVAANDKSPFFVVNDLLAPTKVEMNRPATVTATTQARDVIQSYDPDGGGWSSAPIDWGPGTKYIVYDLDPETLSKILALLYAGELASDLLPDADGTRDLGSSTKRWAEVHADSAELLSVDINGGAIDGTVIGGSNQAAGAFTTVTFTGLASRTTAVDGTEIGLRLRNSSSGVSAQTQLSLGNDSDANDLVFVLNSSGNPTGPGTRGGIIRANAGALRLQAGSGALELMASTNIVSTTVYNATTATAANVAVDSGGEIRRSTSSRRYKRNIRDYTRGLLDLLRLRPVSYESVNDGDSNTYAGLIAEEVHDAGLTEFVVYDGDGQPDALHYPHMISLAVAAIKELKAQNDALEERIAALEASR